MYNSSSSNEKCMARNLRHAPAKCTAEGRVKTNCECKMAASRKRKLSSLSVDYSQLNSFSSAVLYDTAPKSRKSKFYAVERIIERRRRSQVNDTFCVNIANILRSIMHGHSTCQ